MMEDFATIEELETLWRPLQIDEKKRATELLTVVSSRLRYEAKKVKRDLDQMINDDDNLRNVAKMVTIDIVARALMTSTTQEPMTQFSESAMGYSFSGTFLSPGGGLFIKRDELKALGLSKQRFGLVDYYAND